MKPGQPATILALLRACYPDAGCQLVHQDAFELLVATVLSAQTTDERVNSVTPELFARWPGAHRLASAELAEVEQVIRPLGFFRTKAQAIVSLSAILVADHGGQVPQQMAELVALPGVGRKTAHVVRGHAFGLPAITTDTHVLRLSRRFGWTTSDRPRQVEDDIAALFDPADWLVLCDSMILHGRAVCLARRPHCDQCRLAEPCPALGVTR